MSGDFRSRQKEGGKFLMPTGSHMRCKNCGVQTHRNGNNSMDLCWKCWRASGAPATRAERQRIKLSRRERREQRRHERLQERVHAMPKVKPTVATDEPPQDEQLAIAEPQTNGHTELPKPDKPGTPEWAAWMRQYRFQKRLTDQQESEILVLYEDLTIPLHEIEQMYDISGASLARLIKRHGVTRRNDRPGYRSTTLRARHARKASQATPQEAPDEEAMPDKPAEPSSQESIETATPREREILRLYEDFSVPVQSICQAFRIYEPAFSELLFKHGVVKRRLRPGYRQVRSNGHFVEASPWPIWVTNPTTDESPVDSDKPRGPGRPPARPMTPTEEEQLVRLYRDSNQSVADIQGHFGLSPGRMFAILERHGIPSRTEVRLGRERKSTRKAPNGQVTEAPPNPAREWVDQATAALEADEAKRQREAAMAAAFPLPRALATAAPPAPTFQLRTWSVTYVIERTEAIPAANFDDAVRQMRDLHGTDIDIVSVNRI